jgi:hypothetical protein
MKKSLFYFLLLLSSCNSGYHTKIRVIKLKGDIGYLTLYLKGEGSYDSAFFYFEKKSGEVQSNRSFNSFSLKHTDDFLLKVEVKEDSAVILYKNPELSLQGTPFELGGYIVSFRLVNPNSWLKAPGYDTHNAPPGLMEVIGLREFW